MFNQSQAILRALGIEFGYYLTTDPWQAWACDWAMDTIQDFTANSGNFRNLWAT
jgi:hypothetical protein